MLVTFNHLRDVAIGANGTAMPIGNGPCASQSLTAAGATTASTDGARLTRVGTDTAITIDGFKVGQLSYMPAGSSEWFPTYDGRVFTIAIPA